MLTNVVLLHLPVATAPPKRKLKRALVATLATLLALGNFLTRIRDSCRISVFDPNVFYSVRDTYIKTDSSALLTMRVNSIYFGNLNDSTAKENYDKNVS